MKVHQLIRIGTQRHACNLDSRCQDNNLAYTAIFAHLSVNEFEP